MFKEFVRYIEDLRGTQAYQISKKAARNDGRVAVIVTALGVFSIYVAIHFQAAYLKLLADKAHSERVIQVILFFCIFQGMFEILSFFRFTWRNKLRAKIITELRRKVFRCLVLRPTTTIGAHEKLELFTADVAQVAHFWAEGLLQILMTMLLTFGVSVVLWHAIGPLGLVFAVMFAVLVSCTIAYCKVCFDAISVRNLLSSERIRRLQELLFNVISIKANRLETLSQHRVKASRENEQQIKLNLNETTGTYFPFFSILRWMGWAFVVYCLLFFKKDIFPSDVQASQVVAMLFAVNWYSSLIAENFVLFGIHANALQLGYVSMRRLENVLSHDVDSGRERALCKNLENAFEIENLTLEMGFGTQRLKNLSVTIPKGKLTVIHGDVGSGKSDLLLALLGEIKAHSGVIRQNIGTAIAYIPQSAGAFSATLRDSLRLRFENSDTDDAKLYAALGSALMVGELESMPERLNTWIGERGITLSGGQKQRLAISRAAFYKSETVLLDDPVSALDTQTADKLIRELLSKEWKGKTVVFTTHRKQYLTEADWQIELQSGRVVYSG